MDFDQMLETWRAQNTAPPYDVNRDALRQALQNRRGQGPASAAHPPPRTLVRLDLRNRHGGLGRILDRDHDYQRLACHLRHRSRRERRHVCARGRRDVGGPRAAGEPERNFGNTLQEEVRRSLALVDYQLSVTRRWIISMLGAASISGWHAAVHLDRKQEPGHPRFIVPRRTAGLVCGRARSLGVWASYKARDAMRKARPKLELRQRRLRELLAALDARE